MHTHTLNLLFLTHASIEERVYWLQPVHRDHFVCDRDAATYEEKCNHSFNGAQKHDTDNGSKFQSPPAALSERHHLNLSQHWDKLFFPCKQH